MPRADRSIDPRWVRTPPDGCCGRPRAVLPIRACAELARMLGGGWGAVTRIPWQCRIGDRIKTGKTKCRLGLLADRRVRMTIDRLLGPRRPVRVRGSKPDGGGSSR